MPVNLAGWVRRLGAPDWPVLARTAESLEEVRENEDAVDARMLTEVIAGDPLMTLKLLAQTAAMDRTKRTTDAETVREALVLMGITPFFRVFGPQASVETALQHSPEALAGLMAVVRRAERASRFALSFALHRFDHDAEVICEAALLHDFAEMLLWLRAPEPALEMQRRQAADPTLRSAAVQRQLLGTTLADVQHELMLAWRLPALLTHITDDRQEEASQVRNVLLAIRIARHTALGWDNPAVPDDVRDIAQLLNLGLAPTETLLHDIDS